MFIAHLPAGYLLARTCPSLPTAALLISAIAPGLDMLVFHFVHHGQIHHHSYLTHRPVVWAVIAAAGFALRRLCVLALGVGGVLHMVLDSVVGAIDWGWPLVALSRPWVTVPARYAWWVLSFLTHWTFAVELSICAIALWVWKHA